MPVPIVMFDVTAIPTEKTVCYGFEPQIDSGVQSRPAQLRLRKPRQGRSSGRWPRDGGASRDGAERRTLVWLERQKQPPQGDHRPHSQGLRTNTTRNYGPVRRGSEPLLPRFFEPNAMAAPAQFPDARCHTVMTATAHTAASISASPRRCCHF